MKKLVFFIAGISIFLIVIVASIILDKEYQYANTKEHHKNIKNVILVIACSLRADHLSCYGYERETSPNIDRLAEEGILFKNCFSQAPYTFDSVASIMTSKYPRKLRGLNFYNQIPDQAETFAEIFKKEGFYTMGFMANPWISKPFNFHQGFDYFFDTSNLLTRYKTDQKRLANRVWGQELTKKIINKLKETEDKFFLQILYIDNHLPYTSFPPFKGKFISDRQKEFEVNCYDETILNFDAHIGELVKALKELNLLDSTLMIITSDHGDAFGRFHKHDIAHGSFLYNTVIKTPLIFYSPNLSKKGTTINNYVTCMDILPTTLDLIEIQYDRKRFDGISQKEVFNVSTPLETPKRTIISETNFMKIETGMRRSCVIWNQRWKLIHNYEKNRNIPDYELYDLENDPHEINNLFNQKKNKAEDLILLLKDWQKKNTPKSQKVTIDERTMKYMYIKPEIKRQLKALGYIE